MRGFRGRREKDRELAEELEAHLRHSEDEHAARGFTPEEARRQARLRLGNTNKIHETVWQSRSLGWIESFWRDVRFAARSLARTPGFAAVAILVLTIGIAVNTAVFSVVDTVLLEPLTYPNPQELVRLRNVTPQGSFGGANVPKFNLWRQQTGVFRQVAAYDFGGSGMNITESDHPQQVQAIHVSADYFPMFGAPVLLGRTFTGAEDSPHGGNVVVLSHSLWASRYGSDPKIVGRAIALDGEPYTVVGVIARGFVTDSPVDLWVPFQFDPQSQEMAHFFTAAARLQPGVTIPQANAQLKLAAEQFRRTYGDRAIGPREGFDVVSLQEDTIGDTRLPLLVLLGAVGLVLLIACANVANLLLARALTRRREFATRAALGAGRGQLVRQLLAESLLLSLVGGLVGLVFGYAGVRLLVRINPGNIPRIGEDGAQITMHPAILLFALAVSLLTCVLFGLLPALQASKVNLAGTLNEQGTRSGMSLRTGKLRSGLVMFEVALSLILVIGAALLMRTFANLQAVNPGFTTNNVLTMNMSVSGSRFQTTAPVAQVIRAGTDRLMATPGVADVGVSNCLPMRGGFGMTFDVVGRPSKDGGPTGGAEFFSTSWRYFETFQIPVLRGRVFTERDVAHAPLVAVINEAMAKQYWPNGDPLRDQLRIGAGAGEAFAEGPRQVIGIVGDTHDDGPGTKPQPLMYIPLAQMPDLETALNARIAPLYWIVRTKSEPRALAPAIVAGLRDASGGLPVAHIYTMREIEATNTARQRFNMMLLGVFGASGVLLAAIGIYGVMAYSVRQRTQELGVRIALGAQASDLRSMVIRQSMTLALVGIGVGVAGALGLTRFLSTLLFGVKALDPAVFVITSLALCGVALLATWIPARQATRVNPMVALRAE